MNCQEVQTELSEYLENSLDAVRIKNIEIHLLSCPLCRAEADDLSDCIQQIAQLPMVEPPPGFTQRVMAHVHEIESKPSFWQRLFVPFRLAPPIQATAVVFIAILAVFLYQKESQIKNNSPAQSTTSITPAPLSLDTTSVSETRKSAEPPVPDAKAANDAKSENTKVEISPESAVAARRKTVPEFPSLKGRAPAAPQPGARADAGNTAVEVKDVMPRRAPIQAQEVATGRENLRPAGDTFGIAALPPALFAPERALSPITEPSADMEFIVRPRQTQQRERKESADARGRVERDVATSAAMAKRANPAAPQESSISEIRWFAVPADRYEQFRKELVAEAAIESEKTIGAMERDFGLKSGRELLIKVIILGPAQR
jgi:Putative zinc-finger/Predicted integral membrane protein (DUF2275)